MTTITVNDMIKEIRKECRENGLTFKRAKTSNVLYKMEDRRTGDTVWPLCTINEAYCSVYDGVISSYDVDAKCFNVQNRTL